MFRWSSLPLPTTVHVHVRCYVPVVENVLIKTNYIFHQRAQSSILPSSTSPALSLRVNVMQEALTQLAPLPLFPLSGKQMAVGLIQLQAVLAEKSSALNSSSSLLRSPQVISVGNTDGDGCSDTVSNAVLRQPTVMCSRTASLVRPFRYLLPKGQFSVYGRYGNLEG